MDSAPVMLWRGDVDGGLTYVNTSWVAFRGRSEAQELGDGWLQGVFAEDRSRVKESVCRACRDRRAFEIEHRLRRADGDLRLVSMNGAPVIDDTTFHGHIGTCVDVTDNADDTGESHSHLEALINNSRDMAYRLRLVPERGFDYAVGAVEAITGRPAEDFFKDPTLVRRSLHPDDAALAVQNSSEPDRLATTDMLVRWVHPDGKIVWAEHRRRPVFDAAGRIVAIEGIARDVTRLIESQQQLKDSEDQMRQLAARLQTAREEERAQVARELHDELGQTLTALKLEIGRAIAAMQLHKLAPEVIDRMQSLMGLSEIGISTVKRIATNLRPPALDHLGLVEAIRWEALAFKARSGLRCHVRANKKHTQLTSEQQTAAFRIVQEALTNVARHARASAVTVTISERQHVEIRIRDNGKGISHHDAQDPRAIGLIGMRERAALVGGSFSITGTRGKGTTVSVQIPLTSAPVRRRRTLSRKTKRSPRR